MSVQEKLYTADDLWNMPGNGKRYELVRGVIVEMAGTGGKHTAIAANVVRHLGNFVYDNGLGTVTGADGAYILAEDLVRIPDAAFISKTRLPPPIPEKFIPMAPDLAVEVVSPGDGAKEVRDKVLEYLQHGTRIVWVIYPEAKNADVYTGLNNWRLIDKDGALDGGEVLPGFTLPLDGLFKNLE